VGRDGNRRIHPDSTSPRLHSDVNPAVKGYFGYQTEEVFHEKHQDADAFGNIAGIMNDYLQNFLQTGERKIIGSGREVVGLSARMVDLPDGGFGYEAKQDGGSIFVGSLTI